MRRAADRPRPEKGRGRALEMRVGIPVMVIKF
jgi:hypothetical protein